MADISVRPAQAGDGGLLRDIYARGTVEEFTSRLAGAGEATRYHLVEMAGSAVAVLAVTELGRLRPGAPPRSLLHEIKLRPCVRNLGVIEAVLRWLASETGAGTERELIVLAPLDDEPAVLAAFGLKESHRVFRWPVPANEVTAT
ncbi:hypothetical protein [Micromonospora lupini]|uniref:hypothetical protein n=1 Tax=Micromonospora lupini TaxID=285679 RepID=UPI0033EB153B